MNRPRAHRAKRRGRIAILPLLLASVVLGVHARDKPEEPDFFFLTGGPYTQGRHSPQIIWANQFSFFDADGIDSRDFVGAGRFEWGLTDRWEVDFEFGALHSRRRPDGAEALDEGGVADFLLGIRYRLLDESRAPLTLTLGPQVILPAASRLRGLGSGEVGYGVDVTAAKDWGGPVFAAASVNLSWTPNVALGADGSGPEFDLMETAWAVALGWRPVERATASGTLRDLHVFFELAGERVEDVEAGGEGVSAWVFAPGLRYGFVSRGGSLAEIGVAFPIGLDRDAPDWGWILQFQFEWPSPE